MKSDATRVLIRDAVSRGIIPSAAYAVGRGDEVYLSETVGYRSLFPTREAADEDTLYDLASLSKLVSTTMVALRLVEEGRLLLSDPLSRFFSPDELEGAPDGRSEVTVFHLMTHTAGITPHLPLWRTEAAAIKRTPSKDARANAAAFDRAVVRVILSSPPVCGVGEQVYYSCMGYILLQKIVERVMEQPLDILAQDYVFVPLGMSRTGYCPLGSNENKPEANIAATEHSPLHGYFVRGHVHDENAHFLGGISGNAGVFAPLADVVRFAKMLSLRGVLPRECGGGRLLAARTFETAVRDYTCGQNESRGLGFQLRPPLPRLSAAGDLFAYGSYGHTGFTGTSLYVDAETGVWGVLLTNAVHLGRDKTEFFRVRRQFYNTIAGTYL